MNIIITYIILLIVDGICNQKNIIYFTYYYMFYKILSTYVNRMKHNNILYDNIQN